jgi:hypothetical protein
MNVYETSPPPSARDTPSPENNFEGENGSVKPARRSGISKRTLAEKTGGALGFIGELYGS